MLRRKRYCLRLAMARRNRSKLTLLYNTSENHQKIAIAVGLDVEKESGRRGEAAKPRNGKPISTAATPVILMLSAPLGWGTKMNRLLSCHC